MENDTARNGFLYRATFLLFAVVSLIYIFQLLYSMYQFSAALKRFSLSEFFLAALGGIRGNPIPTFVILTTIAIKKRSDLAIWIHLAMVITANFSFIIPVIFIFAGVGLSQIFPTLLSFAFAIIPIPLLIRLIKTGELR